MNLAHLEDWTLRLNDPRQKLALALRISIYTSHNGFKSISDVHFLAWKLGETRPADIKAFREIHDRNALKIEEGNTPTSPPKLKLSGVHLEEDHTFGSIYSNKRQVTWDLKLHYRNTQKIQRAIPHGGIEKHETGLQSEGSLQIGDQSLMIRDSTVCRSWSRTRKLPYKRIWASASHFVDHSGRTVDFQFEGTAIHARKKNRLGPAARQDYFFFYDNLPYRIQGFWASLRNHSDWNYNSWEFRAEAGDLSFRGRLQAENRELCGFQWVDTDEKNVFKNQSGLADLTVHVYRSDKLEATFHCRQAAFFETIGHEKNPYSPYLY